MRGLQVFRAMPLDQETVQKALRTPAALAAFSTCAWPAPGHGSGAYAEHCLLELKFGAAGYPPQARNWSSWRRRTLFEPPAHAADAFLCGLTSYHATCRSDVGGKEAVMRMVAAQRARARCV